jgi:hypothetical protein
MAVVSLVFGFVLFVGFVAQNHTVNMFLLQAASAATLLGILYAFNAILTLKKLKSCTIDFTNGGNSRDQQQVCLFCLNFKVLTQKWLCLTSQLRICCQILKYS